MKRLVKRNKKGSIILEAAITLPIFIITCISLIITINIIKTCNDIVYNSALSLKEISEESYGSNDLGLLDNILLSNKISQNKNTQIINQKFLYSKEGYDDLISIKTKTKFDLPIDFLIDTDIDFTCNLTTRAFTGKIKEINGLNESEFLLNDRSNVVVIFPRYGIRFHSKDCKYVVNYIYSKEFMMKLQRKEATIRGFTPCEVCGGGLN